MDLAPRRRPSTEETCEETGDVSPDSPPPDVYPTSDVCVSVCGGVVVCRRHITTPR